MASYSPITVSGYNSSPPADNGAATEANRVLWATIKTKLGDPLKTAIDALDNAAAAAFTTITANLAVTEGTTTTHTNTYNTVVANLYAPAATAALFKQTSAPTGWTKGATHNNKALRLVSGAVSTGGSTAFTSVFTSRTIAEANLPAHTHSWASGTCSVTFNDNTFLTNVDLSSSTGLRNGGSTGVVDDLNESSATISGTASISSTNTGSAGSGTAMDFAVKYADLIIATKD